MSLTFTPLSNVAFHISNPFWQLLTCTFSFLQLQFEIRYLGFHVFKLFSLLLICFQERHVIISQGPEWLEAWLAPKYSTYFAVSLSLYSYTALSDFWVAFPFLIVKKALNKMNRSIIPIHPLDTFQIINLPCMRSPIFAQYPLFWRNPRVEPLYESCTLFPNFGQLIILLSGWSKRRHGIRGHGKSCYTLGYCRGSWIRSVHEARHCWASLNGCLLNIKRPE